MPSIHAGTTPLPIQTSRHIARSLAPRERLGHQRRWLWKLAFRNQRPLPRQANLTLVLLALFDYVEDVGFAWPSQARLALDTGLQTKTVRKWLAKADASGWIARRLIPVRGSFPRYEYILTFPPAAEDWVRSCLMVPDLLSEDRHYVEAWRRGEEAGIKPKFEFATNGCEQVPAWEQDSYGPGHHLPTNQSCNQSGTSVKGEIHRT
jgi:hypothetical protein